MFDKENLAESIYDININNIDYKWLEKCEKTSHLKRALKILHEDGYSSCPQIFIIFRRLLSRFSSENPGETRDAGGR